MIIRLRYADYALDASLGHRPISNSVTQTVDMTLQWEIICYWTRYCMFLCRSNWNLNVASQFLLYPQTFYWRYHRFVVEALNLNAIVRR